MIVVMIVPTGIGAHIGGHSGDATVAARLLGSVVDTLIVHPNVVNASDINEMPPNALYVEGSTLDRLLEGSVGLNRVKSNRILVVCNEITPGTMNTASAAEVTLGVEVAVRALDTPLEMVSHIDEHHAWGTVNGLEQLVRQVRQYSFSALAIHTPIKVSKRVAENYFKNGGINPWGGVEAQVSRYCAFELFRPVAHAPLETTDDKIADIIVDPRMAAEMLSESHLFSVLKGLHKAPHQTRDLASADITANKIDALVSPLCWDLPHQACIQRGIPIILVENNPTSYASESMGKEAIPAANYYEAAGMLAAIREGISTKVLTR